MSIITSSILSAPFKRPRLKKHTNLNLNGVVKDEARKLATKRYGISLSDLTERLYALELSHKTGLLPRATTPRHGPRATKA